MIIVTRVTSDDNLDQLVREINAASWDDGNEMAEYDAEALSEYLDQEDALFLACHDEVDGHRTLLGVASARVARKPYGRERWLYVDEVDVCADQRRKGAGQAIMRKFIDIAQEAECCELWVGTEATNQAGC